MQVQRQEERAEKSRHCHFRRLPQQVFCLIDACGARGEEQQQTRQACAHQDNGAADGQADALMVVPQSEACLVLHAVAGGVDDCEKHHEHGKPHHEDDVVLDAIYRFGNFHCHRSLFFAFLLPFEQVAPAVEVFREFHPDALFVGKVYTGIVVGVGTVVGEEVYQRADAVARVLSRYHRPQSLLIFTSNCSLV